MDSERKCAGEGMTYEEKMIALRRGEFVPEPPFDWTDDVSIEVATGSVKLIRKEDY